MVELSGARGRTAVWRPWDVPWSGPWTGPRRRPGFAWPEDLVERARGAAQQVRAWAADEVRPGRLVPWLAIAFGCGSIVYFAADQEPELWAAAAVVLATLVAAILLRHRPVAFAAAVALAALAAGFATATAKRALIAHPVLAMPLWNVEIGGFVEAREERERSDRITVRVHSIAAPRLHEALERVRVSVRKGAAPAVGSFVAFKARLSPPLEPLRPGGYDFARDMYFQRIGASGFALGRIRTLEPPQAPTLWLRYAAAIDGMREAIDKRIRAVVPGDKGAIASALLTGKRDALSTPVFDAMYVSGIGHVLSISGYHMAVVVAIVFFVMRASLALVPGASRHPIKKWAAVVALAVATFYLLLSGAEVATQRSYIMIAIVLVGVMIDRATVTFRTLTVAALGVMLLAPEAVVHPSFQMSFAATLALVASYQQGLPWLTAGADTPLGARIALWGLAWVVGSLIVSLMAGTATLPYAAYHFHRLGPYGALTNLLAMPVVSVWVMPMGILGIIALPFGLDGWCWQAMGAGLDWMIFIALWVTSLPGAFGRMAAFGTGALLVCSLGLVVLCLLKTPLRWAGAFLIAIAVVMMIRTPKPDVLIAADGSAFAIRGEDGRLAVVKSGSDAFAVHEWLAADADARDPKDKALGKGIRCDEAGCVGRLRDGALVAIAKSTEAFEEDCRRAALVVSARDAPQGCAAQVVDRPVWRGAGAMTLRRTGAGFEVTPTRTAGYDRPWSPKPLSPERAEGSEAGRLAPITPTARAPRSGAPQPLASQPRTSPPRQTGASEATPREDDLDAGN
jgi:competence protein ComEC